METSQTRVGTWLGEPLESDGAEVIGEFVFRGSGRWDKHRALSCNPYYNKIHLITALCINDEFSGWPNSVTDKRYHHARSARRWSL